MTALDHLCFETGTFPDEWEDADGTDSGVGVDHHLAHRSHGVLYVNDDQGPLMTECCSD